MPTDLTLYKEKDSIFLKKITSIKELTPADGYLIDTNGNEKETRKIIDSLRKQKPIIAIQGYDNTFNRRVLETMKINYLISPEKILKKDNLKQRDSGINHVTAKIAQKNNISLIIDINEIKKFKPKEKSINLSRIIQNIKICRKAKSQIKIASLAKNKTELISKRDRQAFLFTLGASSEQVKNSTQF